MAVKALGQCWMGRYSPPLSRRLRKCYHLV